MDESTTAEQKYEIYNEVAPYFSENVPEEASAGERAGDGSLIASSDAKEVHNAKTAKKRRRKVTMVKQHWRHLQPSIKQSGPFNKHDEGGFNVGHGGAA